MEANLRKDSGSYLLHLPAEDKEEDTGISHMSLLRLVGLVVRQRRAMLLEAAPPEDRRCGSPVLPITVPIQKQRPAKAKHLGIVQVNVTSWGPLLSSTSMLSTFHLAFVQEHRARDARLDELRSHFQKAGWRGYWSPAACGKQGASKGGVAILSRPCLRVDEHLELYGGRLVTARVHVRKLGWVQTYWVYGDAGQQ